jgi:hypothetical protein
MRPKGIKAYYYLDGEFVNVRIKSFKSRKEAFGNMLKLKGVILKLSKLYRRTDRNRKLVEEFNRSALPRRREIIKIMDKLTFEKPGEETDD